MAFFDALKRGLQRSRQAINEIFYFGGEVDEQTGDVTFDTTILFDFDSSTLTEKGKEDPRFADLAEIVARHRGLWCLEAENYLLSHWENVE